MGLRPKGTGFVSPPGRSQTLVPRRLQSDFGRASRRPHLLRPEVVGSRQWPCRPEEGNELKGSWPEQGHGLRPRLRGLEALLRSIPSALISYISCLTQFQETQTVAEENGSALFQGKSRAGPARIIGLHSMQNEQILPPLLRPRWLLQQLDARSRELLRTRRSQLLTAQHAHTLCSAGRPGRGR